MEFSRDIADLFNIDGSFIESKRWGDGNVNDTFLTVFRKKGTDKQYIHQRINQLVLDNIGITYEWITNEELDKNPELVRTMSVKPPKTEGKIRLVKIGEIDLQPCGGTHVKETKEIGSITIGKIENKGKMNRRINININD